MKKYEIQYYDNIPLRLIKRNYGGYKAKRFTINGTNQNVWIPNKHLENIDRIRKGENLDYVFEVAKRQNKFLYAGMEWKKKCIK